MSVSAYFVVVFVGLHHLAPMSGAIFPTFTFKDVKQSDVLFTDYALFDISAQNVLRCANQCSLHIGCEVFTFTFTQGRLETGGCRGYSAEFNASESGVLTRPGAETYKMDQCFWIPYTVLDDFRRYVNHTLTPEDDPDIGHCDLKLGWYRVLINGSNAVIPTRRVQANQCGSNFPHYLDLQGNAMPNRGHELESRVCVGRYRFFDSWGSCVRPKPVTVRNCGAFYLYKLNSLTSCSAAYCAEPSK
ncbi:hypothetical protein V1264_016989 [Littorina saxatilis]|uniref:UMOD/GP2/OIT3-like D8C domain-containing protein n=1 Tax=Littorina saxatilis TaxID=31220 RepID=A0AAN9BH39_9CAEN